MRSVRNARTCCIFSKFSISLSNPEEELVNKLRVDGWSSAESEELWFMNSGEKILTSRQETSFMNGPELNPKILRNSVNHSSWTEMQRLLDRFADEPAMFKLSDMTYGHWRDLSQKGIFLSKTCVPCRTLQNALFRAVFIYFSPIITIF